MSEASMDENWRSPRIITLFLILPLVLGVVLSLLIPHPVIGIIRLDDAIYSYSADFLIQQIEYARQHSEIRAVLLVLNSPGGNCWSWTMKSENL